MRDLYADIIIDISHEKLDRAFQYRVPERLKGILAVGMCVQIPFGQGNAQRKGYVIGIGEDCKFDPAKIKEILDISPEGVSIEGRMVALAGFLRRNFGGTMIQALQTVLPAKRSVAGLERKTIRRILGREETLALLGECERRHQTAKARLLRELAGQEEIPYPWVTGRLGVSAATIKSLEREGAISVFCTKEYRNPVKISAEAEDARQLSAQQAQIVEEISRDREAGKSGVYLIHGITGSGKTEIYIQLIDNEVRRGRQAILLIPEIALTYQTLLRFYKRFGDRVSVINSTLSPGEKYDQCQRAQNGGIDVIIGPRSALFTPFPNLGLIVMDEEHEGSYKSENTPKYHAREAALEAARLSGAGLVLGSATPSLEAYTRAKRGEYKLFTLRQRLSGGELPTVHTVDMRRELREGNRSVFSRKLQGLMAQRLEKGQQIMLFLNRRGYAGFLSCRSCGLVMKCPHCDVSLSEHRGGKLICHYCGYAEEKPALCPKCGSKYMMGFRAGTQQIEEKLKELFLGARILRMDGDTTRKKDSYERILAAFANGEADVLIGTQMIVKGHDFPNVTLVGVLAADLSLGAGSYRAGERTFELLTQAVGRAGRGSLPGEAVIQTYQPEHYAVVHAARQDYESFYEEEILYRELSGYPPIAHMLAVQICGQKEDLTKQLAERLSDVVKSMGDASAAVIGPAPGTIGKINDVFRFVFYVKHGEYGRLVQIKDALEEELSGGQPAGEVVQFDFDPINPF